MNNKPWIESNEKVIELKKKLWIPDNNLTDLGKIEITCLADIKEIIGRGGCYWIATNEPIYHMMQKDNKVIKIGDLYIIYNGIAKDDLHTRILAHLFAEPNQSWSGISVDVLEQFLSKEEKDKSHWKCVYSEKKKKKHPYIISTGKKINSMDEVSQLNLWGTELDFIKEAKDNVDEKHIVFRNGININDNKHCLYKWVVYYLPDIDTDYASMVEKGWRKKYGNPILNSYKDGR